MLSPFGIVAMVLGAALIALPIAGIIDATRRPVLQWKRVGLNRTTWIALMGAGTVLGFGVLGVVAAIEYLISVRPKLQLAAEMGDF
ncbi:MAG TPA: hypothetical protein VG455_09285 [Acidimicrobiales bacterium]|nr:hypothetical protein [Acidimicrobiales bacterium]